MSRELMLENIRRAQKEIDKKKEQVKMGAMRQYYHFMPQTGWLNDPNGLIYFRGKYHLFYQYNPYYGFWDYIHWGHAVSEDMVHWRFLPLALAPSEPYDDYIRGGCFSGSAIEHEGKLFLIYTGAANHGNGNEQTQCIAYSEDGIHFEKYDGNPVLKAPQGIPSSQFRDPKVWKHEDTYYMVCGASRENKAQVLLYRSKDMFHWEYVNVLAESRGEWGFMWECPDFYQLGDKYVLTVSPMGAGEHTAIYFVGDFEYHTGKFIYHTVGEIDWGLDYYAPQSFLTEDGRRVMIGWANEWEWMSSWKDWGPTYKEGWCGFYSIPREVRLMGDYTLQFIPIEELHMLRKDGAKKEQLVVSPEGKELSAGDGVSFEMKMKVILEQTDAERMELNLRCGNGKRLICTFDFKHAEIIIDRDHADGWSKGRSRSAIKMNGKKKLDIHIFSDKSSVEIFTDQYQNNHSNNIFAQDVQNRIQIRTYGGNAVIKEFETYGMEKTM